MPGTVLLAEYRVEVLYSVDLYEHKARAYCKLGSDPMPDPSLVHRDGTTQIPAQDALQAFVDALATNLTASASVGYAALQQLVGISWVPIFFADITFTPAHSGGYVPATQFTLSMRDTSYYPVKVIELEGGNPYLGHSVNGLGIDVYLDDFVSRFNGTATEGDEPFYWMVSRGNRYLAPSGTVSGGNCDLNQKIKRGRNLE